MVNDFTGGSFMETNYHSQFDNDGFYDEDVYRMHHELFGLLLMAIDRTVVVPLDFSRVFRKARERLDSEWCEKTGADGQRLLRVLEQATATAQQLYAKVEKRTGTRGTLTHRRLVWKMHLDCARQRLTMPGR